MSYETVTLETDSRAVAWLTLNRPEKHNALNAQLIDDLRSACRDINADKSIRVVVLTGKGESFCAGGDLAWMKDQAKETREEKIAGTQQLASMLHDLDTLSKPLIGRINGQAFGGGTGMISVCDVPVGLKATRFAVTDCSLGLVPATISPYVVARMGLANARSYMYNAKPFTGEDAKRLGLLAEAVDDGMLDEAVEKEIGYFLRCSPVAVEASKKLAQFVATHGFEDNLVYTADRLADAWETEDGQEGIRCFFAKETPWWQQKK